MSHNLPNIIPSGTQMLSVITGSTGEFIEFTGETNSKQFVKIVWANEEHAEIIEVSGVILKNKPFSVHTTIIGLPIPDELMTWLGYISGKRYVGLYWDTYSWVPIAFDGSGDFTTLSTPVWNRYTHHKSVSKYLKPFNLGSSESKASQILIIDTVTNKSYVTPIIDGLSLLHALQGTYLDVYKQNGEIDKDKLFKITNNLFCDDSPDFIKPDALTISENPDYIERIFEIDARNCTALNNWLDTLLISK